VQGRKLRKKCAKVSTMRCECSLNPGKKRGKCGTCAEGLVGAPSPTPTPTGTPTACSWQDTSLPPYPSPKYQYEPLSGVSPDITVQNVVEQSAPPPGDTSDVLTGCDASLGPCCDLSDLGSSDGEAQLNKCWFALGQNLDPVWKPKDPTCTAGVGCGVPPDPNKVAGVNANLNTMGLITHGWDSGEANNFINDLPEVWRPGCHTSSRGVRWSTSIVNRLSMTYADTVKFNESLPAVAIYNVFSGGVILNPKYVQINCLFNQDAGTDARNYNGCGRPFSSESDWDWCDRGYDGGVKGFGGNGEANGLCVGAPTQLNSMFQSQEVFVKLGQALRPQLRTAYNEAVVIPLGSTKDKPEGSATPGTPIAAFYTPMSQNRASYPGGNLTHIDYVDPNLIPCGGGFANQPYPYGKVGSGANADGVPSLCLPMTMGNGTVAVNGTGLKCCQQEGDPDADTYSYPSSSGGCEGIVKNGEKNTCISILPDASATGKLVVTCQAMCNFYKVLQVEQGDASEGACNSKPAGCPPLVQLDMFPPPEVGPFKILCKDYKECFDKKIFLHSPSTCTINPP